LGSNNDRRRHACAPLQTGRRASVLAAHDDPTTGLSDEPTGVASA
jgi:hypothetical protein